MAEFDWAKIVKEKDFRLSRWLWWLFWVQVAGGLLGWLLGLSLVTDVAVCIFLVLLGKQEPPFYKAAVLALGLAAVRLLLNLLGLPESDHVHQLLAAVEALLELFYSLLLYRGFLNITLGDLNEKWEKQLLLMGIARGGMAAGAVLMLLPLDILRMLASVAMAGFAVVLVVARVMEFLRLFQTARAMGE